MDTPYDPPLSLTIIGTIFIGLTTLVAAWITFDIVIRRGWETMMAIMIPVYILNALYLAPITLWTYLNYGRPTRPKKMEKDMETGSEQKIDIPEASHQHHDMNGDEHMKMEMEGKDQNMGGEGHANHGGHQHDMAADPKIVPEGAGHMHHAPHDMSGINHMNHEIEGHNMSREAHTEKQEQPHDMSHMNHGIEGHSMPEETRTETHEQAHGMPSNHHDMSHMDHGAMNHDGMNHSAMHHDMHMPSADQPMFPTVTIAVCHCGAGCLLGDIVGEWLVFGTNATLGGRSIGPEFLIDYGFALLFGIFFQYFSIAPMSGDYGPKTLWRAAKADFLSLTFFEIGLFGWMAIFQFAIFNSKLRMDNVVYWWMMQVGMFFGHWTAFPINWWLITSKVKERVS